MSKKKPLTKKPAKKKPAQLPDEELEKVSGGTGPAIGGKLPGGPTMPGAPGLKLPIRVGGPILPGKGGGLVGENGCCEIARMGG